MSASAVLVAELTEAETMDKALKVYVPEVVETFYVLVSFAGGVHLALVQSQTAAETLIVTV